MTPETAKATIKNPRWWIALPVLLPVTILVLGGWLAYRPLWWLGQAICGLSNAVSPYATTPRPIKAAMEWVQRGAST